MDQEDTGVIAEVAAQDQEVSEHPQQNVESEQERNWREMRKTMERLQQRNMELEAERRVREEMAQRQTQPQEEFNLSKEDWVTGADVEKYTQTLVQKQIQDGVQRALKEHEDSQFETRLKSTYSDYETVVSPEAIENLKMSDPEFVALLQGSGASKFEKGAALYKYLKKQAPSARAQDNKQRFEENQKKPRSIHEVSNHDVSGGDALNGRLTPDLKAQLWKEMQECASRR